MGYAVHITRKTHWSNDEGPIISLKEWLEYVASDPEMRMDGYAEAQFPDGVLRIDDPSIAVWTAYPRHGVDGNMAWFSHFEDCISVNHPDASILKKMHQIALSLGASVQGDDGELYGSDGKRLPAGASSKAAAQKPWWRFWE